MKTNNHPNWLVPIEIAKKLKEIGTSNSEILVCNDDSYGWYRNGEIYDYDNDGEFIEYTALEVSKWKNSILEPTYTWEQVFEWFRGKGLFHSICIVEDLIEKVKDFEIEIRDNNADIICILHQETYEGAREAVVKKLIEIYKQNENGNNI